MFLVFCEEDRSYLIVEENKAIFDESVKKDDEIQFFHCNKIYTGCVIGRSDDENELALWRKQTMEKDKESVKASKLVHGSSPKKTKRLRVPSIQYSPPSAKKKTTNKGRTAKNKTNKGKTSDTYNAKTQQLTSALSSSSDEQSSDEDRSNKSDNHGEKDIAIAPHDLVCDKTQQPTTAKNLTIAALIKRLTEMEETNAHLQMLLKEKRALSPSSSGIESFTDSANKENIHAGFENRASVSTDLMRKQLRDVIDKDNVACEQIKQNEAVSEKKPNENIIQDIEEPLADTPRKLHQLYGKDFNEDGETMVLLRNDVFCKSSVLHNALGSSTKTTHLVRKLVCGVFKEEIFKKEPHQITLTGNAPRTVGKQAEAKYSNIDVIARSAIIKYAKAIGKLKKWPYVRTKDLERTLSQKIGELKRQASIN